VEKLLREVRAIEGSRVTCHQPRNASLAAYIQGCKQNINSRKTPSNLAPREMGLPQRMENLHAPTVPSGPTSAPAATNGTLNSRLTFPQLQARKDNIEAELRALGSVLESVGGVYAWDTERLIVSSMASI
jgi:hypothetical protein